MAKIAIIGFGVVGSGVYEVIKTNFESISEKAGENVDIKYILDIRDFSNHPDSHLFVDNFDVILNDDEVSVVVETIGGLEPGYTYTKKSLARGKHVVTSNKELVATYGDELLQLAKENNVNYLFEASVGGGIPIIRPLNQCLTANEINKIVGILNGTTNYILTKMVKEGIDFDTVLKDAQEKGYAERNPAADVEGHDACRKICILASLASGKYVDYTKVSTEGITNISLEDVSYAAKMDSVIKLLGYCSFEGEQFDIKVCPMIISNEHPLSHVDDVFNGILVQGNAIGDAVFYGRGAGKLPTASAVVADVIDAVKHMDKNKWIMWHKTDNEVIKDIGECNAKMFVRVDMKNANAEIEKVFGKVAFVSLYDNETAFVTDLMNEKDINEKLEALPFKVISKIRVLAD